MAADQITVSSINQVNQSDMLTSNLSLNNENKENGPCSNGNTLKETSIDPLKVYFDLEEICRENCEHFKDDTSEKGKRLHKALTDWIDNIQYTKNSVEKVLKFAGDYDFDKNTPGNGFRSFIRVTEACTSRGLYICKNLTISRRKILFRKGYYIKEVESCNALQASLKTCLDYLFLLKEWSHDGELFAKDNNVEALFEQGETINQYSFYGRCLGFQYRPTIQGVLRFISIAMAGFSESYYSNGGRIAKTTSSVWTGGKYFLNPELRARRIVNISQNANIDFCKSFWFLAESELMHAIPSIVGHHVKVNTVINIPPEPISLNSIKENKEKIEIPVPSCHIGPGSVAVRLLSANRHKKMLGNEHRNRYAQEQSKNLLFHCHGGGFVAQSSKSHELYLRDWAVSLQAPILSVDYSLAPEAPFPRALDEVFYAYCWAIKNAETLGWTGEKMVVAGDSAGANLCLGVTLKCIQMGIRKPDGIFLAYCPTLVNFIPSPARLLCLMDPILPFGFMMRCLKAYACPSISILKENKEKLKNLNEIIEANANNVQYSLDLSSHNNSRTPSILKNSISSSLGADGSKWEYVQAEDALASPFSDGVSDTFASASYNNEENSQTVENTELTPGDVSSCLSFEDDSQPITHMPIDSTSCSKSNEKLNESEEYIDSFLQKYVGEQPQEGMEDNKEKLKETIPHTRSEENLVLEAGKEIVTSDSIQSKLNSALSSFSSTLNKFIGSNTIDVPICNKQDFRKLDALIARSPTDEFVFEVPKDPFLSPYYSKDEDLKQYPRTKILTVDMDPCLDDCVMFAKKLKNLNIDVSLDILEGLPHGFLNFTMMSSEAMDGSKMCASHIAELFAEAENDTNKSTSQ